MQKKNDYSNLILNALLDKGVIDESLYEKCSKPSYISELPGDLRTTDLNVLNDRKKAIEKELKDIDKKIDSLEKEISRTSKRIDNEHDFLSTVFDEHIKTDSAIRHRVRANNGSGELSGDIKREYDALASNLDKYYDKIESHYENGEDISGYLNTLEKQFNDFEKNILNYYGKSDWRIPEDSPLWNFKLFVSDGKIAVNGAKSSYANSIKQEETLKNQNVELDTYTKMQSDFETELEYTLNKINTI